MISRVITLKQLYLWVLSLAVFLLLSTYMHAENIKILSWRYRAADEKEWHPCTVPGIIQDYLIQAGKLPNPHYRQNEKLVQGVEDKDWVYTAEIKLPESLPVGGTDKYILSFKGIDTYSTIKLNGKVVGHTDNMFVGYDFDVRPYLQRGTNTLEVYLHAPLKQAHPLYEQAGINYPADNDHAPIHYSVFTRKAPYSYGWDWGMRLVTMGIWQPVTLTHYKGGRITSLDIRTEIDWDKQTNEAGYARIYVNSTSDYEGVFQNLRIRLKDGGKTLVEANTQYMDSDGVLITLPKPKLWWPKPWGQPHLYTLEVVLFDDAHERILDEQTKQIGIREVKLVRQADHEGTSFYFRVNKQPLFAKGANYIPGDNILTKRTDEAFRKLFDDVEFAEMNMLRVWGGGIYEDERFYEEADRRGILIWQDFMFACTAYPADSAFLDNVRREADYQVRRLKHHPSIVLWCGNNEIEEGIKYWGWQSRYSKAQYERMRVDYELLFRELLPQLVQRLDPDRTYIHSSPYSANWGRPESWLHSDVHYWGLWYGKEPFDAVDSRPMRFASEYGFQSFPDVDALKQFARPEDMSLESDVMRQHQKASTGNSLIREYMERDYHVPTDFEDFVYVGQVLQARGMEHVMQTLRRWRPVCMGSLYWQLNDAWPCVSWSSVDYYQNYKALHYTVRRSYAPLILCTHLEGKMLSFSLANDYLEEIDTARLAISVKNFEGKELHQEERIIPHLKGNTTTLIDSISVERFMKPDVYIDLKLSSQHGTAESRWYPVRTKEMKLPHTKGQMYDLNIKPIDKTKKTYQVEIKANCFLKDVFLSVPYMGARWSDNLLDLARGEKRTIILTLNEGTHLSREQVRVRTMNEINNQ